MRGGEYGKRDREGRSPETRKNSGKGKGVGGAGKSGMGGSPENADLLYEYFPLSLDDWYVFPLLSLFCFLFKKEFGLGA